MKRPPTEREKMFPRDAAGSFSLEEGTGDVTDMVSCGDFLEIYKIDKTFKVVSPESVDPERTNPNAPWVISPISDVGSSNPIVARFFIQSAEMLKSGMFRNFEESEPVILHLHGCKESLLKCEALASKVANEIDRWITKIEKSGVSKDNRGRALNPFPMSENLASDCTNFFISANRAIKQICEIAYLFLDLPKKDSNFDYLEKTLSNALGDSAPFTTYVRENSRNIGYLIALRNFDEHPGEKRTTIKNFHVLPDGDIQVPLLSLEGGEDETKYEIKAALLMSVEYLLDVAEAVVIHSVLDGISDSFPFIVQRIPESEIDQSKPIRHRLTIDISKLKFTE